ncbi:MAG TPA: FAD-dependent oxidoreductase [Xanthobacteraceae bacterium]|nr:FAD-dependent oxidoreductase [Xanthobacteraceae bacterium]
MARTDTIVLGAGIVGTAIALHLAKRGLSVALVDRRGPGEETSYGNTGIIEGNTVFPAAFPRGLAALARVACKRAPEANYHLSFLPKVAPWLVAYRAWSQPEKLVETARAMRPLFSRAIAEHEALMAEAGAGHLMRKTGWLKLYRRAESFAATARERAVAEEYGIPIRVLDPEEARALEPSLNPVFRHALNWEGAASLSNPLALTRAYAARLRALGGVILSGDARSLHREGGRWRVDTAEGPVDAADAVVALGPWAPDLLAPLGIKLPMAVKRGYHRHFAARGNAGLSRPVLDADNGYCLAPMEQGIRLTTGAEFADRDAAPTPVQFDRLMPAATGLFALGAPIETSPWMGSRPCFADSRPVIGPAPGQAGLWLAFGHAHWGLTLAAVTGRLIADLVTKTAPVVDPAPYRTERFAR